jgi:hypothetical protein
MASSSSIASFSTDTTMNLNNNSFTETSNLINHLKNQPYSTSTSTAKEDDQQNDEIDHHQQQQQLHQEEEEYSRMFFFLVLFFDF